ncbi:MAG: DUF5131 family protein, partial [Clostridia bacterium]|nr:DUF5131 family protein [Clostridia bacterium]
MGRTTKIDWCDSTWNPVTGCLHGCEYCYARKMAERFAMPNNTKQTPAVINEDLRQLAEGATLPEFSVPYHRYGRVQPYPHGFTPTFHRYKL